MSIPQRLGAYPAVLLVMATVLSLGGFICGTTGSTPPPPTAGAIYVNIGFGAVTNPPYDCTGSGTVTITPQSLTGTGGNGQEETRTYTFSGKSSTTPNEPACQVTVNFPSKTPGTWQATNGQAACIANLIAGQSVTVKIHNGVCQ
jgi:hypothetical protein